MISFGHTTNFYEFSFRLAESIVQTLGLLACIVSSKHKTEWTINCIECNHHPAFSSGKHCKWCFTSFCEISNFWFLLFLVFGFLFQLVRFFSFFFFNLLFWVSKYCRYWWLSSNFFFTSIWPYLLFECKFTSLEPEFFPHIILVALILQCCC